MTDSAASPSGPIEGPGVRVKGPTVLIGMVVVLTVVFVILCLTIALPAFARTRVPVDTYEVVASYPHDTDAFTQGLVYTDIGGEVGSAFFESTGRYGHSTLRLVDVESGKVLRQAKLSDRVFAEGLTMLGGKLYQLTWKSGRGFIYDASTFDYLGDFELPRDERTGRPIEGWGLTTDGESLIISDGSYRIRFVDPETFEVTKLIEVRDDRRPIMKLNELEFMHHEIWSNVWGEDSIVRISPKTGVVRGYVDLEKLFPWRKRRDREAVLNGIAFDQKSKRIFVTGKLWPKVYEIRVTAGE